MTTSANAVTINRTDSTNLKRFWLLCKYNFLIYVRNKAALFWVIIFPIGYMLLFGSIYGGQSADPNNPNSLKVISFMVPGLVVMSLMSNGIIGNAGAMAVWREKGILRRLQSTPLPIWHMLLSRILVQSAIMVVQSFLLIGISIAVFGASFDTLGMLEAIPFIILGAIVCMAIGQMIAALIRKPETVQIVSQVVFFPLMFLSGLFIPMNQLPDAVQAFGKFLPTAMISDLIRGPMLNSFTSGAFSITNLPMLVSLAGVVIYFVIAVALAARYFKWN